MSPRAALLLLALLLACASDASDEARPRIFDCSTEPCEDCAFIDSKLRGRPDYNFGLAACTSCQGVACGTAACSRFPCSGGKHVIRACNDDEGCAGLSSFCGRYTGMHNVCVVNDDV